MNKLISLLSISGLLLFACADEDVAEEAEQADTEEVESESKESTLPEEIRELRVTDTRNDTTGNWRKVVTSANVNMPENALAYNEEYMEEDEIHHIISFATNTTSMINEMNGTLYVDITEYEDKEEHSADTIGSGMLLGSYAVYKDTGEIDELE